MGKLLTVYNKMTRLNSLSEFINFDQIINLFNGFFCHWFLSILTEVIRKRFSEVFRGYRKTPVAWNELTSLGKLCYWRWTNFGVKLLLHLTSNHFLLFGTFFSYFGTYCKSSKSSKWWFFNSFMTKVPII